MYSYPQNQYYPSQYRQTTLPAGALATMGFAGAVIGGAVAAARDLRRVKDGAMTREHAVGDVVKEAVGSGLATAAGAAAAGTFFRSSALSLAAMAVVGVGTKYLFDGLFGSEPRPADTAEKA